MVRPVSNQTITNPPLSGSASYCGRVWEKVSPRKEDLAALGLLAAIAYASPVSAGCGLAMYAICKSSILASPDRVDSPLRELLDQAPQFKGYRIGEGTNYPGTTLTSLTLRPANLFFHALLGKNSTTLPGSGQLFAFNRSHEQIKKQIAEADPDAVVSFSAKGITASIVTQSGYQRAIPDLADLHGDAAYQISYGELQSTLESQKIYTAPQLPIRFYSALKQALLQDGIVILPGSARSPVKLRDLQTPHCRALIRQAAKFFESRGACNDLLDLTLYQLGSLVVKTEDFRIFIDSNGKLLERTPGESDAIRLINACGIRGIHSTPSTAIDNSTILQSAFRTALIAAENGYVIFPAVGMGVWGGDPDLYWRAFLDAVVLSGDSIEQILVNPGHQMTNWGVYRGFKGEEFQTILKEYRASYSGAPQASANLSKIIDLFKRKSDVVQLAHLLKKTYPDKTVSLFNASDPDVTLGNHVGEYVNNLDHATTTEENYTALGTNGLCFEGVTGVHADPSRLIPCRF